MRIGMDIDGVLADFAGAANQWIADHLGVTPRDVDRWDWFVHYGEGHEVAWNELWRAILAPDSTFFLDLAPLEHAREGLRDLLADGHELEFVTARPESTKEQTGMWLMDLLAGSVDGTNVPTLTHVEDKATTDCDIYLDDSPEHLEALAKAGKRVVCMSQPWNKAWRKTLPTPIAVVFSVREFAQCLRMGQWTYGI